MSSSREETWRRALGRPHARHGPVLGRPRRVPPPFTERAPYLPPCAPPTASCAALLVAPCRHKASFLLSRKEERVGEGEKVREEERWLAWGVDEAQATIQGGHESMRWQSRAPWHACANTSALGLSSATKKAVLTSGSRSLAAQGKAVRWSGSSWSRTRVRLIGMIKSSRLGRCGRTRSEQSGRARV